MSLALSVVENSSKVKKQSIFLFKVEVTRSINFNVFQVVISCKGGGMDAIFGTSFLLILSRKNKSKWSSIDMST